MSQSRYSPSFIRSLPFLSYDDAHRRYSYGLLSEAEWRLFLLLWTWSAPRLAGPAGWQQDRFWKRRGGQALEARFARARKLLARLVAACAPSVPAQVHGTMALSSEPAR